MSTEAVCVYVHSSLMKSLRNVVFLVHGVCRSYTYVYIYTWILHVFETAVTLLGVFIRFLFILDKKRLERLCGTNRERITKLWYSYGFCKLEYDSVIKMPFIDMENSIILSKN